MSIQTQHVRVDRPKLRVNSKICTEEVKAECAIVSAECNLSAEKSRLVVQTVCKQLYDHKFSLTPPIVQNKINEPAEKKRRVTLTASDYENYTYTYVIPSARTINDYKQMQASQVERDAACKLLSMDSHIKSTLHYNTTSRNRIDGEWLSKFFAFSSGEEFVLRPVFFAYEDRQQIVDLLVETYHRLLLAVSVHLGQEITSKQLWEKSVSIMTDSVAKKLQIEDGIAETLNSIHIPYHLLCKSHTVEKTD